jgi:hypothetical protein
MYIWYFLMKTSSKTIFSFIAAGLLLSATGAHVLAQSDVPSPKPLSPKALKKLCLKTPTDPRCTSNDSSSPTSPAPTTSPGSMSNP